MNKKLRLAKAFLKDGDSALKTGLFKWNKDYPKAAKSYEESATLYRMAGDFTKATAVYEKCIPVHQKLNDINAVAKCYENIIMISLERTDGVKPSAQALIKYTIKAGKYYRLVKSHHAYITLVQKVAQHFVDASDPVEASNLYKNLVNDLEEDDQEYLRSEIVGKYTELLIGQRRISESVALFEREYALKRQNANKGMTQNLDTLAMTIVILNLVLRDLDKAERTLQDFTIEIKNFIKQPEFDVCEKMIEAIVDGDQEKFDHNAQRSIVNNVYPFNIIKELRKVKVKTVPDFQKNANNPMSEEERQRRLNELIC